MPKRIALSAALVVLVFCLITPGEMQTAAQTAAPAPSSHELRIIAVNEPPADPDFEPLRKRLDEVSFQDAPLDQVFAWCGAAIDANLVVRFRTLEEAGIERDKPITFQGRGLTAAQVLWVILAEAGGPDTRLGYEGFDNNLLIVSTREDLDRDLLVRIYDVSPLLDASDAHWEAIELRREQHQAKIRALRGVEYSDDSRTIFGGNSQSATSQEVQSAAHTRIPRRTQSESELLHLLESTIRPDSWTTNGGVATAECFNGLLVVRASRSGHRELAAFQQTLNEMAAVR